MNRGAVIIALLSILLAVVAGVVFWKGYYEPKAEEEAIATFVRETDILFEVLDMRTQDHIEVKYRVGGERGYTSDLGVTEETVTDEELVKLMAIDDDGEFPDYYGGEFSWNSSDEGVKRLELKREGLFDLKLLSIQTIDLESLVTVRVSEEYLNGFIKYPAYCVSWSGEIVSVEAGGDFRWMKAPEGYEDLVDKCWSRPDYYDIEPLEEEDLEFVVRRLSDEPSNMRIHAIDKCDIMEKKKLRSEYGNPDGSDCGVTDMVLGFVVD